MTPIRQPHFFIYSIFINIVKNNHLRQLKEKITLRFKRILEEYNDIALPEYSTDGSAGIDIRAAVPDFKILQPGKIEIIPTNLQVEIPESFELQIRPRSGLAANSGIGILNSPGTIDSDYRGEIKIILINLGTEPFTIRRGDRIAQMVLTQYYKADIQSVNELSETKRSSGGFGHTGI